MTETPKVHLDVFFVCMGQQYPVGHGDIPYAEDQVQQAGLVATLLHQLAWQYEEAAQHAAEDGDPQGDVREVQPRVAFNRAGDRFFEVAPDEFVAGMSYDDAVDTYRIFGGATPFDQLKRAYPGLRWEYL